MKVAVDISPIQSSHKYRGIGSYTQGLYDQFKTESFKDISFDFFSESIQDQKVDLVHYPYFDIFFRSLHVPKKIKTVVTIHDVIPLVFPEHFPSGLKGNINLFFQRRELKKCTGIICDSKTSKEDIVNKLSVPEKKVHVVYLAPAPNFKKVKNIPVNLFRKYKLPKKFLLYVGDVNWNKNIKNLLEAIHISKQNIVMVGKALTDNNLTETKEIEKQIKALQIENNVIKTGYVPDEDLVFLYNLAQATILPSYYEGFGLPVLESMACGTQVICSKVASQAEISSDDALYCDPSDPTDIASSVKRAFEKTESEQESLSKKLIKHASNYSWEKVAKQTVDIYRSL